EPFGWQSQSLQLLEGERVDAAFGMASGRESSESTCAELVEDSLRHDRASGIPYAQKQHVEDAIRHSTPSSCSRLQSSGRIIRTRSGQVHSQHFGPQHFCAVAFSAAVAGFTARINALINLPSTWAASASTSSPLPLRNSRASSIVYTLVG